MGPRVIVPVVTYLFHRIDQRLDGRPTLIILDEAWVMLSDSSFGAKIEEWLRTLRKKNVMKPPSATFLPQRTAIRPASSPRNIAEIRDIGFQVTPN
jgi:hypothetical protein